MAKQRQRPARIAKKKLRPAVIPDGLTRTVMVRAPGTDPFEITFRAPSGAEIGDLLGIVGIRQTSVLEHGPTLREFIADHLLAWSLDIECCQDSLDKRLTLETLGELAKILVDTDWQQDTEKK